MNTLHLQAQLSKLYLDGSSLYAVSSLIQVETDEDLEVADLIMAPVSGGIGDVFTVSLELVNHGESNISPEALSFDFTASKDSVYGNGDDIQMAKGLKLASPLLANSNSTVSFEIEIPNKIVAGQYVVFVSAKTSTDIRERNAANNHFSTSGTTLDIPEWVLNLSTNGNGQINQDFSALRYPQGARVSLTANAGKGAAFAGWGGDAIGGESQITILMDGDKTVQANFSSRASLQVHVRGAGSVDGLADLGSYAVNDTAALTAVPTADWEFSGWSGAASGSSVTANILMDAPKVVTANFVLPVANWKSSHFTEAELQDTLISGDDADPDGDGLKNWQEYLHLSDPRDAASRGIVSLKLEGDYLYAIFTRNAGAVSGLGLGCQGSRDLADWDAPDLQERLLNTRDGVETVEARLPVAGGTKGFLRLKYDRP